MDQNTQNALEFNKVKAYLAQFTCSALGKMYVDSLTASADMHQIALWLSEVSELKEIRTLHGLPPFG
ncbi:MAG: hypothetical protein GY797_35740, partial [Deltaproteobacteria bacterium]|nr:hypothetical protein [Deltaproteobacteria bacterium]